MKYLTGDDNGLWKITDADKKETLRKALGRDYTAQSRELAIQHLFYSGGLHGHHEDEVTVCRANGIVEAFDGEMCNTKRRTCIDAEGAFYGAVLPGTDKKRIVAAGKSGFAVVLDWDKNYSDIDAPIDFTAKKLPKYVQSKIDFNTDRIQAATSCPIDPKRFYVAGKEVLPREYDLETGKKVWEAKNVKEDDLLMRVPVSVLSMVTLPSVNPNVLVTGEEKGRFKIYDTRQQRRAVYQGEIMQHGKQSRLRPLICLATTPVLRRVTQEQLKMGITAPAWGSTQEEAEEHWMTFDPYGDKDRIVEEDGEDEESSDDEDEEDVEFEPASDAEEDEGDSDEDGDEDEDEDEDEEDDEDLEDWDDLEAADKPREPLIKKVGVLHNRLNHNIGTLIAGDNIGNVYKLEVRRVLKNGSQFASVTEEDISSSTGYKRKRLLEKKETQEKMAAAGESVQALYLFEKRMVGQFARNGHITGSVRSIDVDANGERVVAVGLGRKAYHFNFKTRQPCGDVYLRQKLNCVALSAEALKDPEEEKRKEEEAARKVKEEPTSDDDVVEEAWSSSDNEDETFSKAGRKRLEKALAEVKPEFVDSDDEDDLDEVDLDELDALMEDGDDDEDEDSDDE